MNKVDENKKVNDVAAKKEDVTPSAQVSDTKKPAEVPAAKKEASPKKVKTKKPVETKKPAEVKKIEAPKKEKKKEKSLTDKLRYKGDYELLPEKELHKQLRFYHRRFVFKYAAYFTAVLAFLFTFAAYAYNTLIALAVLLIVLPGILWSILGALRVRGKALIIVLIGLGLNVLALIIVSVPLFIAFSKLGELFSLIMEYIQTTL